MLSVTHLTQLHPPLQRKIEPHVTIALNPSSWCIGCCHLRRNFDSKHHAGQLTSTATRYRSYRRQGRPSTHYLSCYLGKVIIVLTDLCQDGFRQEARPHREEAYVLSRPVQLLPDDPVALALAPSASTHCESKAKPKTTIAMNDGNDSIESRRAGRPNRGLGNARTGVRLREQHIDVCP